MDSSLYQEIMSSENNMWINRNDQQQIEKKPIMPAGVDEKFPKCPRCDSSNTKFCYYNNYSLSQPRYFCKSCRRYWTKGGTLRNIPVGGGCRKANRRSSSSSSSTAKRNHHLLHSSEYMHAADQNMHVFNNNNNNMLLYGINEEMGFNGEFINMNGGLTTYYTDTLKQENDSNNYYQGNDFLPLLWGSDGNIIQTRDVDYAGSSIWTENFGHNLARK